MTELRVRHGVNAERLCTLAIPTTIEHLVTVRSDAELKTAVAFAARRKLPAFPLGDGSNIIFAGDDFRAVAIRNRTAGIQVIRRTKKYTDVRVAAGHNWDAFVRWAIGRNLSGIESMSIVPGTVGASPVQNVGCYGQEVSETITAVRALDARTRRFVTLSNGDCRFGYRTSVFKRPEGKRYLITNVTFRLLPGDIAPIPQYASLQAELARRGVDGRPTLRQIRKALIVIRTGKLPDPKHTPTAGSFFHNPVVSAGTYLKLAAKYPAMPHYPAPGGKVKLSAPWLIDTCGLKGYEKGGIAMYKKQAVVLINPDHRPAKELLAFRDFVAAKVRKRFGVTMTMEPELVGA